MRWAGNELYGFVLNLCTATALEQRGRDISRRWMRVDMGLDLCFVAMCRY